jgi:hypothetical protein
VVGIVLVAVVTTTVVEIVVTGTVAVSFPHAANIRLKRNNRIDRKLNLLNFLTGEVLSSRQRIGFPKFQKQANLDLSNPSFWKIPWS